MTATPDTSGPQTTLADVNFLRARRVTLHSNSDLDDFGLNDKMCVWVRRVV
ncbi:hypothetical protein [Corynebacterium sanguinis]